MTQVLKLAMDNGYLAYKRRKNLDANPYDREKDMGSYNAWKDGWNKANEEDLMGTGE